MENQTQQQNRATITKHPSFSYLVLRADASLGLDSPPHPLIHFSLLVFRHPIGSQSLSRSRRRRLNKKKNSHDANGGKRGVRRCGFVAPCVVVPVHTKRLIWPSCRYRDFSLWLPGILCLSFSLGVVPCKRFLWADWAR